MNDSNMYKDLSFGRYLKACREDLGMSLEQIEDITKIRKPILLAIEQEEINDLPDDIFVKGFLRAYALALRVDGADLVNRYVEYKEKLFPQKREITGSEHKFSYDQNMMIFLIGFAILIIVILFFAKMG
jgi:cytoskeletal protein RodZ